MKKLSRCSLRPLAGSAAASTVAPAVALDADAIVETMLRPSTERALARDW